MFCIAVLLLEGELDDGNIAVLLKQEATTITRSPAHCGVQGIFRPSNAHMARDDYI
jgi:hypothetical protein